ncbi:MAG: hypothetical protein F6J87_17495 [Spirulina sp. SIO3F2]|nr:hypothetical protein [Spirulina sp. SIO3F2]
MLSPHPISVGLTATTLLNVGLTMMVSVAPTLVGGITQSAAAQNTDSADIESDNLVVIETPQVESLLTEINRERERLGLPAVQLQPQLMVAAQAHATDMAEQNFFSPEGSDSADLEVRVRRTGYPYRLIAENLGIGQADAAEIVQQWLDSTGYRLKLLNPDYQDVGIGYAYNPDSDFGHYWVLVFGASDEIGRQPESNVTQTLLALTNQARQQACLPLFEAHPTLTAVAQTEAAAIAVGETPTSSLVLQQRLAQLQYPTVEITTLQALDAPTPSAAWAQWQAQAASLAANPLQLYQQSQVGFGVAMAEEGEGRFWTMMLAQPPMAAIALPTVEPFVQERGRLEPGIDPVLPVDGSTYDLYSFVADAGQTITVTLSSSTFDTYLFLFNAADVQIADNDDISGEDSNSQLQITLPCDGEYTVMVNSYDPTSEGEYDLSIYNSP